MTSKDERRRRAKRDRDRQRPEERGGSSHAKGVQQRKQADSALACLIALAAAFFFADHKTKETLLPPPCTNWDLSIDTSDLSSAVGVGSCGSTYGASSESPLLCPSNEGTPIGSEIAYELFA
jgi:hypothetical protein